MYIANFGGDSVTLLDVNKSNGELSVPVSTNVAITLSPPNVFNTGNKPIALVASPTGPFLYIANQGSGDIFAYTIDPGAGGLGAIPASTSTVPFCDCCRCGIPLDCHFPESDFLFTADPLADKVAVFAVGSDGKLTQAAGSPFTVGAAGATPIFVATERSGRFIYVADPAHNVILGFAVQSGGTLTPITGSPFAAGAAPSALCG